MTPEDEARLRAALARIFEREISEEPDISCGRCGRVIYCGDLTKLCGKDCYKLQEQNAKSNNLK